MNDMKMRCLIFCSGSYSIKNSVSAGFEANGFRVQAIHYQEFFPAVINRLLSLFSFLPTKVRQIWEVPYSKKVNSLYLKKFNDFDPGIVFIYNNQLLMPQTVVEFKKHARIVFTLGDHPLYTPTNKYNLVILFHADYIFCPDTQWVNQLRSMGIKNVHFDFFAHDPSLYYEFIPSEELLSKYGTELVYIGHIQKNNWGYKRLLFLHLFNKYNFRVYLSGDGFRKLWEKFFPGLESKVIRHDRRDPKFNNILYNCSKISPVDLVPSLFNGVHVRIFDILGAGSFPLCEYSSDLDKVFEGLDVPFIRSYEEATAITDRLLAHDDERRNLVKRMREVVEERHSPEKVVGRLIQHLDK